MSIDARGNIAHEVDEIVENDRFRDERMIFSKDPIVSSPCRENLEFALTRYCLVRGQV